MYKRKASDDDEGSNKFSKKDDTDDDYDDDDDNDSDDGKKYEILKEDDIEGQEAGEITNEGDVQITPFNMKEEMEEGHFDSEGMYHWNKDTEIRDNWLENIDWVKIKENDGKPIEKEESDSDGELKFDDIGNYKQILHYMKEGETVATALRRLGGTKSLSASERLKMKKAGIVVDKNNVGDAEAVNKLTELADSILTNLGNMNIYQETFEEISEKVKEKNNTKDVGSASKGISDLDMYADDFDEKEKAGLDAVPSTSKSENDSSTHNSETDIQWELKRELSDEKIQGPYSTREINKLIQEEFSKTPAWIRRVGSNNEFYSSRRIDFELYL